MKLNIDEVLRLLAIDDVASASLEVFSPFFQANAPGVADRAAGVWLMALSTAGSNPYRALTTIQAMLKGWGATSKTISRRDMGRALHLPVVADEKDPEEILRAVDELSDIVSKRCLHLLLGSIREHGWRGKDLYVTIDGRLRPFWGLFSRKLSLLAAEVARLSSRGRLTSPAMRSKKYSMGAEEIKASVAKWDGTLNGHHWLHLTVHNWRTCESFPLSIQFRHGTLESQVRRALEILAKLPVTPHVILVDKEFSQSYDVLAALREYADSRKTLVVGPMRRFAGMNEIMKEEWNRAAFIEEADETLYLACRPYRSSRDPCGSHHVTFVYTLAELRPDLVVELGPSTVCEEPGKETVGMAFYTNRFIRREEAQWFAQVYARRWACEAMFARHVTMMGRSQSPNAVTAHFGYIGAFLLLAIYGSWRSIKQSQNRSRQRYLKEQSHTVFFGLLQGGLFPRKLT